MHTVEYRSSWRTPALVVALLVVLPVIVATAHPAGAAGPPAPQLSIAVDDGHPSAATGDTLTYAITVRNLGATPVTGLHVTQSVPTGLTFGSADSPGQATPGTVAWLVDLSPTGTATLHTTMSVSATPPELLRLATVACASASATPPPIVCASDSDLLPASRQAAARRSASGSTGAAPSSSHNWYIEGIGGTVLALAGLAIVIARRRLLEKRSGAQPN